MHVALSLGDASRWVPVFFIGDSPRLDDVASRHHFRDDAMERIGIVLFSSFARVASKKPLLPILFPQPPLIKLFSFLSLKL